MADYIRPTPRNPLLGLLADAMLGGVDWMQDPRRTQQMQLLGGLISDTGIPQTVDRIASGEPLTKGAGFATRMKPETAAAAMTLAPEAVPIGRAAMAAARATKGLPVGASIRQVAPREEALRLAQQRAALPISEGGLGLPPNNTPMDRARAMGFEADTYHGTFNRFENFDLSRANPRSQYMPGIFTADNPAKAENYGDYIMPLMQRKGTTIKEKRLARQTGSPVPEVDTIYDKTAGIRVTTNPANIRSRFAAFDPTRRNEPDLLAGALPFTALLDEENRALLEEQFSGLLGR